MPTPDGPLLVFGPRSTTYDFGPSHPLTPRRFGPGIDLLRALGAEPGLPPEPASDEDLRLCHDDGYIAAVRRLSTQPDGPPGHGFGPGDNPPFEGMHEAGAAVAGGSIRALEAILHGEVEHAFHPGGGLHHAMRDRASGFCIYDDPALAIARARVDGLRVLYLDLDVHHGDGVQALFWGDPGVLTLSVHETGVSLFPGTGMEDELGEGPAAGTAVNVPLPAWTGEAAWIASVEAVAPSLAAAFGPDIIVSQHGADSHAWDPLAHLRVTTTAHGTAARLVDRLAHLHAGGRWLATGGGGYDAYRVVPRTWALTWLAGAHREPPVGTPAEWREWWADEAARFGQAPIPEGFDDPPNGGIDIPEALEATLATDAARTAGLVTEMTVPRLLREALAHGWWTALDAAEHPAPAVGSVPTTEPTILASVDAPTWDRLALAPRVVAPYDAVAGHGLVLGALRLAAGVALSAAVVGDVVVGLIVSTVAADVPSRVDLLALGVAPGFRRQGLATRLLETHLESRAIGPDGFAAVLTMAERDPVEPLPIEIRRTVARRLFERAGFRVGPAPARIVALDPGAVVAIRSG